MGPDAHWDSLSEVEIDESDYPDGILYDVDGMDVGLTPLMKTKFKGHDLYHLKHHFFAQGPREKHLDEIKDEFWHAKRGEVLGVVTHEADFARSPEFVELWFQFCRDNKATIRTVRDIIKGFPQDKVVEVSCVRQEPGPAKKPEGIFAKVRKFQYLLRTAKEKNVDTLAAELKKTLTYVRAGRLRERPWYRTLPDELLGESSKRVMAAANELGYKWEPLEKFMRPERCPRQPSSPSTLTPFGWAAATTSFVTWTFSSNEAGVLASSLSDPSIMTEVNPCSIALLQVAVELPWSWWRQTGIRG
jgi:hypothetical protein